jgi:PleD family two-component response regulator
MSSPSPDFTTLAAPVATAPSSKARILVAEDDTVSCELISTRLTKWGYDAVVTHSGTEAMTPCAVPLRRRLRSSIG